MSSMTPGLRKALVAGGVVVAVTGGGAAAVWAATSQVSPSPSSTASPGPTTASPSPSSTGSPSPSKTPGAPKTPAPGNGRHFPALPRPFAGPGIHGEFTVKAKDGTYTTIVAQRGTVQTVSDSSITVKSDDGFTQSYAINSSTAIAKLPTMGAPGRKPTAPPSIKASDLKVGDTVMVMGTKSGSTVTATRIVAGTLPAGLNVSAKRPHADTGA